MNKRAISALIGGILMSGVTVGMYLSLPNFTLPLVKSMNASVGQVAIMFSCVAIGTLIGALLLGSLVKKFKIKQLTTFAALCYVAFFLVLYMGKSLMPIYIGAVLLGISVVLGGISIAQTCITAWFAKNRGKFISFITLGLSVFALIESPTVTMAIAAIGYQNTALYCAIIGGVVMLISSLFLMPEFPHVYGMKPHGFDETAQKSTGAAAQTGGLDLKQITAMPEYWAVMIGILLFSLASMGFLNNASAIFQSKGLTAVDAALMISVYNFVKLLWAPLYGTVVDAKGPGVATAVNGVAGVIGFLLATALTGFIFSGIIMALVAALNITSMIAAQAFPRVFGTKEAGTLIGFGFAANSIGVMLGAPIAGFIFDATQSYDTYLLIASGILIVSLVLIALGTNKQTIELVKKKEAAAIL